ncbi:rRNA maturation RNase YbeY [Wenxinia saemankumensis]|nr:rRNA maturation RNase YbeY [Wenxinia saemankumensis]
MSIDIIIEHAPWEGVDIESLAEAAERATLERLGLEPSIFETALLACDDARIAALNGDFRDRPQPTNVLSWPSEERGAQVEGEMPHLPRFGGGPPEELGDIALAWETCARESEEAGRPVEAHVTHLIVHGLLHLLGFDHVRDGDAALMEGLETEILAKMGVPDPYGGA